MTLCGRASYSHSIFQIYQYGMNAGQLIIDHNQN